MKKTKQILSEHKNYLPLIVALITFVGSIFIILNYTAFNLENNQKKLRQNLTDLLISKKSHLEKALHSRIYYTKGVAAYTAINDGISTEKFYQLAEELIQNDTVINSMALSENCVINAIYPLKGHEAAIGVDLLKHPQRKLIVEETIKTHNTFVAGPVELVEGGIAFISYTPIFLHSKSGKSIFWGVCDIVILKDKLFNEIKLTPTDGENKYAMKGVDGAGIDGAGFWGDSTIFKENPVTVDIILPTGNWTLAALPVKGWSKQTDNFKILVYFLYIGALIISILIWLLTKAIIKIKNDDKELKAIFAGMNEIIIEFDKKGVYSKIAPTNESLLIKPLKEMQGQSVYKFFDKSTADFFINAITECFNTKNRVIIDYPLVINNKQLWFEARISYLSDNAVLYIAHENTTKKMAEDELRKSEKYLSELNETKNKFFSIIAHDLKSPFQTFLGSSDFLANNIDTLDKDEIRFLAQSLNDALQKQYELLTDLLNWAKIQTNTYKPELSKVLLFNEIGNVFSLLKFLAKSKRIELKNSVPKDLFIDVDPNMIKLVLRNLIVNSIKFTNIDGFVEVIAENFGDFTQITVKDNGVGISEENVNKIFENVNLSTLGTANEAGTGLGLILTKEVIIKHEGKIWIESKTGQGSSFIFTLPNVIS